MTKSAVFGLAIALKLFGFGTAGAGAINQFAANPWLNLVITAVFVLFEHKVVFVSAIEISHRGIRLLNSPEEIKDCFPL